MSRMAYLSPHFDYDVFVSYSHGDARGAGESPLKTWSHALIEALIIHEASNDLLNSEKKLESADLLRGMLEEANKPKPNKNILKSLGESLIAALSVVKPLAEAGKDAFEVVKTLWS